MFLFFTILNIFLLGLIGGANPGPVLTSVFAVCLQSGFGKSVKIIFKALVAESIVATLILTLIYSFNLPEIYFRAISLAGAVVLFWLASQIWKTENISENETEVILNFPKIFLITILNGGFWIFWLTICVPQAFELKKYITGGHFVFLLFFELGWLVATVALDYIFYKFRPLLQRKNLVSGVFKFFAVLLVVFALMNILGSAKYFSILF